MKNRRATRAADETHVAELVPLRKITGQEPKLFLVGLVLEDVLVLVVFEIRLFAIVAPG